MSSLVNKDILLEGLLLDALAHHELVRRITARPDYRVEHDCDELDYHQGRMDQAIIVYERYAPGPWGKLEGKVDAEVVGRALEAPNR